MAQRREAATEREVQRAVNTAAIEPNQVHPARKLGVARQTYVSWLDRAERLGLTAGAPDAVPEWQEKKKLTPDQETQHHARLAAPGPRVQPLHNTLAHSSTHTS